MVYGSVLRMLLCYFAKGIIMVPHGLENGKPFSSQGKVREFEQTGKVREFYPKYWKSQGTLPKLLEKWGNLASFYFYFCSDFLIEVYYRFLYLLNSLNKILKKYGKRKQNTGKVREICQSENVGTMNNEMIYCVVQFLHALWVLVASPVHKNINSVVTFKDTYSTISDPDLTDPTTPDIDGKDSPLSTASSSSNRSFKNDDKYKHITDAAQLEDLVRHILRPDAFATVSFGVYCILVYVISSIKTMVRICSRCRNRKRNRSLRISPLWEINTNKVQKHNVSSKKFSVTINFIIIKYYLEMIFNVYRVHCNSWFCKIQQLRRTVDYYEKKKIRLQLQTLKKQKSRVEIIRKKSVDYGREFSEEHLKAVRNSLESVTKTSIITFWHTVKLHLKWHLILECFFQKECNQTWMPMTWWD